MNPSALSTMKAKIIDGILIEWAGEEFLAATAANSRPLNINEIPPETLHKWNTAKTQASPATRRKLLRRSATSEQGRQGANVGAIAQAT